MLDRKTSPKICGFPPLQLPDFEETILSNGIRLLTLNVGDEAVSRLTFLWKAGLKDVTSQAAYGLMTDLLSEGCENMSGKEVSDILESNGAWLKVMSSEHSTLLTLHSLNHTAKAVFPLIGRLVTSPTFPEETLESIKKKCAAEKELALHKPSYQAAILARETLYGKEHPLAHFISPEEILQVNREELVSLHRNTLLSNKPTVFLSGKIDDDLKSLLIDVLCSIPFNEAEPDRITRQTITPPPFPADKTSRKDMPESLQTGIKILIPVIGRNHPDYETLRYLTVALGGYFGSRLMTNIREEKGYTYGVNASLIPHLEGRSTIVISCECDNKYTNDVLKEIQHEIRRLASEEMPVEELETVRNILISNMASILDSPFSISSFRVQSESFDLPFDTYSKQFNETLAMSSNRLKEAALKYLLRSPKVTALAGNKPG